MSQQPTQGDGNGIIPRLVRIEERVAGLPAMEAALQETAAQVRGLVAKLDERCPARLATCEKEMGGLRRFISEVNTRTWSLVVLMLSVVTGLAWVMIKVMP